MEWNGDCTQLVLLLFFDVELATMCPGLLFHRRGCRRKSSVAIILFLSGIMMSRSENGVAATVYVHCSIPFFIPVQCRARVDLVPRPHPLGSRRARGGGDPGW